MSRAVTGPNKAREYETIYILRPDIDADSAEKVSTRVSDAISREKGRLTKVELWGRRRLAYEIAKNRRGVYVYVKYLGGGNVVSEVERNLSLADSVLRYQTVLVSSDVEVETLSVVEDDVKFERVELTPLEEEREESRERQLGLVEPERRQERAEPSAEVLDDGSAEETEDEEEAES